MLLECPNCTKAHSWLNETRPTNNRFGSLLIIKHTNKMSSSMTSGDASSITCIPAGSYFIKWWGTQSSMAKNGGEKKKW